MQDFLSRATTPATVGEWFQGWVDGVECLVSLVVDWFASVELCLSEGEDVRPSSRKKANRALEFAREIFSGMPDSIYLRVDNALPTSKGFATSTMDIAGVFAACAAYCGERVDEERLFSLCARVEASDGIMFSGLALVDHIHGRLMERLPPPPPMKLLVLVPERSLDTVVYRGDARRMASVRALSSRHEAAYRMLRRGLLEGDPALVGEAATMSATLQQSVVPRFEWDLLQETRARTRAAGIAVAHSGTASALLFSADDGEGYAMAQSRLTQAARTCGESFRVLHAAACGGGYAASVSHEDSAVSDSAFLRSSISGVSNMVYNDETHGL